MLLTETLCGMDRRQIVGTIVRDELARRGYKQDRAAEAMHIARSTLHRVFEGAPTVQPVTLRAVEGLLDFPRRFLDLVIAGDVAHIRDLPGLDEDLRRHTLEALADGPPPERSQRRHA
jgi:transcriptional regulator with XRE-family HTH domain